MADSQPQGDDTKELSFRVTQREWNRLEQIAFDESEPGDRTSVSQIGRDAIRKYLKEDSQEDVQNRDPRGRGMLRGGAD